MKKDMKRNDIIEESRSIENNQKQMDCRTKKEYEQQRHYQKKIPAKKTICRETLTNDKRATN